MFLKYREKFHLSWQEFLREPLDMIKIDFEIWGIEEKVKEWKKIPTTEKDQKQTKTQK